MGKIVTAAIDFGTTFSGYAYGFRNNLQEDPPTILTNRWEGHLLTNCKAPTTVLFDKAKIFHSFGYEAEEKYSELCALNEEASWYYFQRFKMMLHTTKALDRNMLIYDIHEKPFPAMTVFKETIKYLKEHMFKSILEKAELSESDIHWVLTVPAIWEESSKQFMRMAAEEAGIPGKDLTLALEPEVAAVHCQRVPTEVVGDSSLLSISRPGSRYVVLDIGGGTVDINFQERLQNGKLKQIHAVTGGPWGGTKVDDEFLRTMCDLYTKDVMNTFKSENMEDYIDLMNEFEARKRKAKFGDADFLTVRVPTPLTNAFENAPYEIKRNNKEKQYDGLITRAGDKLRFKSKLVKQIFNEAISGIVDHLTDVLKNKKIADIDTILMVGGFSYSVLLQETIKKRFPGKKVFVPQQPDTSVLCGAVLFGFNPQIINSRIARYTYGTNSMARFDEKKHQEEKKLSVDGMFRCIDIFKIHVKAGEELTVGQSVTPVLYKPVKKGQDAIDLDIFVSIEKSPTYTTDPGCRLLGSINVEMPDLTGDTDRRVEVTMNFGGTEFLVEAVDGNTQKKFKTNVGFIL